MKSLDMSQYNKYVKKLLSNYW